MRCLTSGGSDKAGKYILGGLTSEVRPLCLSPSLSEPLMRLLCLPRPPAPAGEYSAEPVSAMRTPASDTALSASQVTGLRQGTHATETYEGLRQGGAQTKRPDLRVQTSVRV